MSIYTFFVVNSPKYFAWCCTGIQYDLLNFCNVSYHLSISILHFVVWFQYILFMFKIEVYVDTPCLSAVWHSTEDSKSFVASYKVKQNQRCIKLTFLVQTMACTDCIDMYG